MQRYADDDSPAAREESGFFSECIVWWVLGGVALPFLVNAALPELACDGQAIMLFAPLLVAGGFLGAAFGGWVERLFKRWFKRKE